MLISLNKKLKFLYFVDYCYKVSLRLTKLFFLRKRGELVNLLKNQGKKYFVEVNFYKDTSLGLVFLRIFFKRYLGIIFRNFLNLNLPRFGKDFLFVSDLNELVNYTFYKIFFKYVWGSFFKYRTWINNNIVKKKICSFNKTWYISRLYKSSVWVEELSFFGVIFFYNYKKKDIFRIHYINLVFKPNIRYNLGELWKYILMKEGFDWRYYTNNKLVYVPLNEEAKEKLNIVRLDNCIFSLDSYKKPYEIIVFKDKRLVFNFFFIKKRGSLYDNGMFFIKKLKGRKGNNKV